MQVFYCSGKENAKHRKLRKLHYTMFNITVDFLVDQLSELLVRYSNGYV